MGSRSGTETVVRIFLAFLRQPTWTQAALARECRVGVPAVRRRLQELLDHGVPLDAEEDPPHVYWSVPKGWFPGGVLLGGEDVAAALRLLARLPTTAPRDRLLRLLVGTTTGAKGASGLVVPPPASHAEEEFLPLAEDAAARSVPLRMRYYSARRGTLDDVRHVSIHRVFPGPPARLAAVCHREDTLKWFRVERIARASLDDAEPFRARDPDEIETFVAGSLDGFHLPGARPVDCAFFVRDPEARWVEKNLPGRDQPGQVQMRIERTAGGTRFGCSTAGLPVLARFVVGLGDAARAETPDLASAVREIAQAALASHRLPARSARLPARSARDRKLTARAVVSKRARSW